MTISPPVNASPHIICSPLDELVIFNINCFNAEIAFIVSRNQADPIYLASGFLRNAGNSLKANDGIR